MKTIELTYDEINLLQEALNRYWGDAILELDKTGLRTTERIFWEGIRDNTLDLKNKL